jgi:hypothetical protein
MLFNNIKRNESIFYIVIKNLFQEEPIVPPYHLLFIIFYFKKEGSEGNLVHVLSLPKN